MKKENTKKYQKQIEVLKTRKPSEMSVREFRIRNYIEVGIALVILTLFIYAWTEGAFIKNEVHVVETCYDQPVAIDNESWNDFMERTQNMEKRLTET